MVTPQAGLRYPDLYCIGAQKSATTWLQALLGAHPLVWVSPVKELYFYNQLHLDTDAAWAPKRRRIGVDQVIDVRRGRLGPESAGDPLSGLLHQIRRDDVDDEWYGRIWAHAEERQVCVEIDPSYSLLPRSGIDHMKRLSPAARILLIARDPIERSWSQVRMLIREGQVPDAATAIARRADVIEFSRYSEILRRYLAVFPADQVRAYPYDLVRDDPDEFVRQLFGWLQLPVEGLDRSRLTDQHHVGQPMEMEPADHEALKSALVGEYAALEQYMPEAARTWKARHFPEDARPRSISC